MGNFTEWQFNNMRNCYVQIRRTVQLDPQPPAENDLVEALDVNAADNIQEIDMDVSANRNFDHMNNDYAGQIEHRRETFPPLRRRKPFYIKGRRPTD